MDRGQYTDLFVEESREHLASAAELAVGVAAGRASEEDLRKLFRHAHSIKGLAACMGYTALADLSHATEDLLEALRSGETPLHGPWSPLLLEAFACMGRMVQQAERGGEGDDPARSPLVHRLAALRGRRDPHPQEAHLSPGDPTVERAAVESTGPTETCPLPKPGFRRTGRRTWIRVPTHRVDELVGLTDRLASLLPRVELSAGASLPWLRSALERLKRLADEIGFVPFGALADRIGEATADLAQERGRRLQIVVKGADLQIERSVADRLFEALLHMARNAVAHGIEPLRERSRRGKPPDGRLALRASRRGARLVIAVEDDGRGMDLEALRRAAVARALLRPEDAPLLPAQAILRLAVLPGVSTSAAADRVAGRGAGLDVVREIAEQLGGTIELASRPGGGTRVELRLPVGVVRVEAVVVETAGGTFAVPVEAVEEAGAAPPPPAPRFSPGTGSWLRVRSGERTLFLHVDHIVGRRRILVHPLGAPLDAHPLYTGAALLPGGIITLLISPDALPGSPLPTRA